MFNFFKKKKKVEEKPKNLKLISLCLAFEVANADNEIDNAERELILEKIIRRSAEMLGIKPSIVLKTKDQIKTE